MDRSALNQLDAMNLLVDGEVIAETDDEVERRKDRSRPVAPELSAIVNYVWHVYFPTRIWLVHARFIVYGTKPPICRSKHPYGW